jgi:IclR family transcriptional regulator, acetate operon repressor
VNGESALSAPQRIFAVLRHLAAGGDTANLSDLARATGVNRVTAMRLLADLEAEGILERTDGGGHRFGVAFLTLAAQAHRAEDLTTLGRRILERLSAELGLTSYLVVLDADHALYLLRAVPTTPLVSNIAVGSRVPAHLTTPGWALLAGHDGAALRDLLGPEPLQAATEQSPTSYAALEKQIAQVREHGCAWSRAGFEAGIDSCAAPVGTASGLPVAAISVAGLSGAVREREGDVQRLVMAAAADLSALSGC